MNRFPKSDGDRGFALLIVLWTLAIVSLLFIGLASASRSDAQLTSNLRAAAELEAMADGAIHATAFALMQSGGAAGSTVVERSAAAEVVVETKSLSGLINPNNAPPEMMRALLLRLGADPTRADLLAAAIMDWRSNGDMPRLGGTRRPQYEAAGLSYGPPGTPFETLEELRLVLGMTPALLDALRPHLTLFWDGEPNADLADPVVQAAMRDAGLLRRTGRPGHDVVRITAVARRNDGAHAARRAVVRIGPSGNGRGWRILAWDAVPE